MIGDIIRRRLQADIVESLVEEADASPDWSVSKADLICRVWMLRGWCVYCGNRVHSAATCPVIAAYEADQGEGP